MTQSYYRVGRRDFHWLYECEEQVSPGHSSLTRSWALKQARALALESDLHIELRQRERINDFVGPPLWGNDLLVSEVPLTEARGRVSVLAA